MNSAKVLDIKLAYKTQYYFCTLVMNYSKKEISIYNNYKIKILRHKLNQGGEKCVHTKLEVVKN
jgi:hypothetical protein